MPCVSEEGKGCGACCIAPSISSPIPGMPNGKLAGERCIQLDLNNLCRLFGLPERPKVCLDFKSDKEICFSGPTIAIKILTDLEQFTF
jgi:Fe-S-cluster containining protein